MLVYTKRGVKSRKSYARIYVRDEDIILRFYFSDVDSHASAIEAAPDYIKESFTGAFASCDHCQGKEYCMHQKRFHIDGKAYSVCDGKAFWFMRPDVVCLPRYLDLFTIFYPVKKILAKE